MTAKIELSLRREIGKLTDEIGRLKLDNASLERYASGMDSALAKVIKAVNWARKRNKTLTPDQFQIEKPKLVRFPRREDVE